MNSQCSQIQRNSFVKIAAPLAEKNASTLSGETSIGLNGKKYLVLSNGAKKARPRPPLVIASRTPCEAMAVGTLVDLTKICEFEKTWNKIITFRVACKQFSNRSQKL